MAMKTVGILLAYGPRAKFRTEGLGRYLAAFVAAACRRPNTRIIIACPSWSRTSLEDLFRAEGIPSDAYEFVGPQYPPMFLSLFSAGDRQRRTSRWRQIAARLRQFAEMAKRPVVRVMRTLSTARDPARLLLAALALAVFAVVALLPALLIGLVLLLRTSFAASKRWVRPPRILARSFRIMQLRLSRNSRRVVRRIYSEMLTSEIYDIAKRANQRTDVHAWYVPTALWPQLSEIEQPRLICVPDVVTEEFPTGFARFEGIAQALGQINETIAGGQHFVTYSEHIKQSVLVSRRRVPPQAVHVVQHAPNALASRVQIEGFADAEAATRSFCLALASEGLALASGPSVGVPYTRATFSFLFYASQFRPSKNVITLLRAYEYLLRQRYIGHKLVLTGDGRAPEIAGFIKEHRLERDVLCLHGLSEQQLAAYYKLAELAVNPSLAEGGMPFTYAEALSVGTPVVMADIAVTREIITDPALAADTLFDPYDWRALADKIEQALTNKQALYARQRKFYDDALARRTWDDVVAEHVAILDTIGARSAS